MEDVSRYVSMAYLVGGLVVAWVFAKTSDLIFTAFAPRANVAFAGIGLSVIVGVGLAVLLTVVLWRNRKVYQWMTEVAVELSRVTWPELDETRQSTIIVIVFSVVLALALALFDFVWKFATDAILSV